MAWAARDGLRLKTCFPRGIAPATSLRPAEAAGQVDVNYKPLAVHSFTVACSIAIATVVAARARARYWGDRCQPPPRLGQGDGDLLLDRHGVPGLTRSASTLYRRDHAPPARLRPALPADQGASSRPAATRGCTRSSTTASASSPARTASRVRLYSRPGNDLTYRFTLIVEALARLRSRSCIIDGEAVCCDDDGMPSFDRIRYRRHDASVFLYAFDLIELDGDDLRREDVRDPQGERSPRCWPRPRPACGSTSISRPTARPCSPTPARWAWRASCRSARPRRYRCGRSPDWLKSKNPACDAVRREAKEDWGR